MCVCLACLHGAARGQRSKRPRALPGAPAAPAPRAPGAQSSFCDCVPPRAPTETACCLELLRCLRVRAPRCCPPYRPPPPPAPGYTACGTTCYPSCCQASGRRRCVCFSAAWRMAGDAVGGGRLCLCSRSGGCAQGLRCLRYALVFIQHVYANVGGCACMCMCAYVCVCAHACACERVCVCVHACVCVRVHMCACVCTHVHVRCMHVSVCACAPVCMSASPA